MRQLVPELMETAFTLTSEGTILEGARLDIETEGVRVVCAECGHDGVTNEIPFACPACRSGLIRCEGGRDIFLISLSLEQENGHGSSDSSAS
jgi:hydrogenase nickel incorporation protein HypA/HybF